MVEKMRKQQQKLGRRNTYTPSGASQARSPVAVSLNREETLSEHGLKTLPNIIYVNQQSGKTEQDLRVPVLNMRGEPLMPCKPAKARHLLKEEKAKVVSRKPFTIQLTMATGETKQDITLGVDSGYKEVGFSATTDSKEFISGEVTLRSDVSKKLEERRMYRRHRRNRLWYRKPRFMNRTSKKKKKGWLAPSIRHKVDSHVRIVDKIKSFLPVTRVVVEVAKFDTQKLQNVDIEGVEYQQGQMRGYDNLRAFILYRDDYTCQICNKKEGVFDIHHIIQRKDGGSNRPDNLVCVHKDCHEKFHNGKIKHNFFKPKSFKQTVIMNNIRRYVVERLGCDYTYGYITKRDRIDFGLEKTHYNDAFVISGGQNQTRSVIYKISLSRRNNRCLQLNRKGFVRSIRRKRYDVQPRDIVEYKGKEYISNGCHCKGSRVVIDCDGKNKSVSKKLVEIKSYGKGIVFNTRQFLTTPKDGVSLAQT